MVFSIKVLRYILKSSNKAAFSASVKDVKGNLGKPLQYKCNRGGSGLAVLLSRMIVVLLKMNR